MLRMLSWRLCALVPSIVLLSFVVFLALHLIPGDPAVAYLSASQLPITEEAIERVTIELGLDRTVWEQYASWVSSALMMDFGTSYMTGEPVIEEFLFYFPATVELSFWAFLIVILAVIGLGSASAYYRKTWVDYSSRLFFNCWCISTFILAWVFIALCILDDTRDFPVREQRHCRTLRIACFDTRNSLHCDL
ncbi:ABC transporter permease [Geomicrobium sp. JCM 19055]|uniref:ABC transporter permease n=1 Tax=Geomicrobium sp. JCM 19055 TaxID=1460649 RepID=UPI00223555D5|nr:ABC transporter permease [Geomicrobium sp. JCM 19055]